MEATRVPLLPRLFQSEDWAADCYIYTHTHTYKFTRIQYSRSNLLEKRASNGKLGRPRLELGVFRALSLSVCSSSSSSADKIGVRRFAATTVGACWRVRARMFRTLPSFLPRRFSRNYYCGLFSLSAIFCQSLCCIFFYFVSPGDLFCVMRERVFFNCLSLWKLLLFFTSNVGIIPL